MGTINATAGLPISGRADLTTDPARNFRFLVTFQPYVHANHPMAEPISFGFTSVSGLSMAIESIAYREGGMNTTLHQIPGQATFSPLTLTRGVHLGNKQAWLWIKKMFSAVGPAVETGSPSFQFRSSVTVHVLQHPVSVAATDDLGQADSFSDNDPVVISFRFYNAWISALAYSDLNAGDNAIAVEQMTLVHEGFDMFWESPDSVKG